MKRIMTICVIALATTLSVWAQNIPQNNQIEKVKKNAKQSERLLATLELDKKQTKEFKKINTDFASEAKKGIQQ